jgi:hypothetical protein
MPLELAVDATTTTVARSAGLADRQHRTKPPLLLAWGVLVWLLWMVIASAESLSYRSDARGLDDDLTVFCPDIVLQTEG